MSFELQKVHGNLLTFDADFIVNASNTKLILGSGVSMAFKRHCGVELQGLMNAAKFSIEQNKQTINHGDVIATPPGHAKNFKYALHAAVIDYGKGAQHSERKPTLEIIRVILFNTLPYLNWFSERFNKTIIIVFPLIGCGIGGLNKSDVLEVFEKFSKQEVKINCIIKVCEFK